MPDTNTPLDFGPARDYNPKERMKLAVATYFAEQKDLEPGKKPNIAKLSRDFNVPASSIRNNVLHPEREPKFSGEVIPTQQNLFPAEERALLDRCMFMDDFSIPPDRQMIETLANAILWRRLPGHEIIEPCYISCLFPCSERVVAVWRGDEQAGDLTALGISLILSHHPLSTGMHHQLVRDFKCLQ
ncbi:hypothetical protein FN846DRAFT_999200 [Sphaerosporella brunnea]|uniref:Uncharacterized protein n=1 Tax=Sphaerosporella brunnea TaxID=1250544 RepID=A0A5J5EJ12_9PEZI|nr:hypothetical protein FN846DRAFT_999200 [Sphaerosporella brunnea]